MDIRSLTKSEEVTMQCVWEIGDGARLAHILKMAGEKYGKDWKSQTVSTFLGKLVAKGYLEQYRNGRYYCYHILVSREQYLAFSLKEQMRFWKEDDYFLCMEMILKNETIFSAEIRKTISDTLKAYQKSREGSRKDSSLRK